MHIGDLPFCQVYISLLFFGTFFLTQTYLTFTFNLKSNSWQKKSLLNVSDLLKRKSKSIFEKFYVQETQTTLYNSRCFLSSIICLILCTAFCQATVDIPYASPPQGMKYFTIIGPHIDCMEEQYLVHISRAVDSIIRCQLLIRKQLIWQKPLSRRRKRISCCLCCKKGPLSLSVQLDRSAYVSGESLRLKADIHNRSSEEVRLRLRLIQVSV